MELSFIESLKKHFHIVIPEYNLKYLWYLCAVGCGCKNLQQNNKKTEILRSPIDLS